MHMKLTNGGLVSIYGWLPDEKCATPRVMMCVRSGGIGLDVGAMPPADARMLAEMLMAAADKSEGAAPEFLDVIGVAA